MTSAWSHVSVGVCVCVCVSECAERKKRRLMLVRHVSVWCVCGMELLVWHDDFEYLFGRA